MKITEEKYKAFSALLGASGAFVLARKKNIDKYNTFLFILVGASFGFILSDVIDMIQKTNRDKIEQITNPNNDYFLEFIKKYSLIVVIAIIAINYMLNRGNEKPQKNKNLAILAIFVMVFLYIAYESVSVSNDNNSAFENNTNSKLKIFNTILDSEIALTGMLTALFVILVTPSMYNLRNIIIYPLLGLGGGLVISAALKKHAKADEKRSIVEIGNDNYKAKELLIYIAKLTSLDKNQSKNFIDKTEHFLSNLNERQIIVLGKINEIIKKDENDSASITSISKKLKTKHKFDEKELDTFNQVIELFNKKLLNNKLNIETLKTRSYKAKNKLITYNINENRTLSSVGSINKDEKFTGAKKWIWLKSKVGDTVLDKQIKTIQLDNGNYVYCVGIQ